MSRVFDISGDLVREDDYGDFQEIVDNYGLMNGDTVVVYEEVGSGTVKSSDAQLVMPRKSGKKVAK